MNFLGANQKAAPASMSHHPCFTDVPRVHTYSKDRCVPCSLPQLLQATYEKQLNSVARDPGWSLAHWPWVGGLISHRLASPSSSEENNSTFPGSTSVSLKDRCLWMPSPREGQLSLYSASSVWCSLKISTVLRSNFRRIMLITVLRKPLT